MKKYFTGVFLLLISMSSHAQQMLQKPLSFQPIDGQFSKTFIYNISLANINKSVDFGLFAASGSMTKRPGYQKSKSAKKAKELSHTAETLINNGFYIQNNHTMKQNEPHQLQMQESALTIPQAREETYFAKNRRNIYSSMWAFASLNYLYCDLVAFMDKDLHTQYHSGVVDGTTMTPQFITAAAVMMQISLANVFLPQLIKNERTLRWVQIASGLTMTLIQSASLFVGEPTPYYATFSAFEIGATTFITIDAIRWKAKSKKKPAASGN